MGTLPYCSDSCPLLYVCGQLHQELCMRDLGGKFVPEWEVRGAEVCWDMPCMQAAVRICSSRRHLPLGSRCHLEWRQ